MDAAPFSLPISEGYAEAPLDHELHELAILDRGFKSFHGERIRNAIRDSNELQRMIAAAALLLADPSEEALGRFIDLAEHRPAQALPYAWELALLGRQGSDGVKAVLSGPASERLQLFIRNTIKREPLIAEAYLLDPGAVDAREGLLIDAIKRSYSSLFPSFGVEIPFDQVGMLFLLADHKAGGDSDPSVESPDAVLRWVDVLNACAETTNDLGGAMPRIPNRGGGKRKDPLVFRFWLATQKQRFQDQLANEGTGEQEKRRLEDALRALEGFPSTKDAERALRAVVRERELSLWGYFGREYQKPLERAFEAAASK